MESQNDRPYIFNLYKPRNWTSFDVIRYLKKNIFKKNIRKIGHFGTLDPFAEGVLLVAINSATRLNQYTQGQWTKTYIAKGKLGIATDTGDCEGKEVNRDETPFFSQLKRLDKSFIESQLQEHFLGEYWQAPPAYSAAKFEGKKLCQWAREGVFIKKPKVQRRVYKIKVLQFEFPYLTVEVEVSSGTYIRTLFEDFCQYFGTFGHLEELIRSQIGHNDLSTGWSLNLNDWEHLKSTENWDRYSIALDAVVPLPTLDLCQELAQKVIFGQPLPIETIKSGHREHTEEQLYWAKLERQPFGLLRQSEGLVKSTAVLFRPF